MDKISIYLKQISEIFYGGFIFNIIFFLFIFIKYNPGSELRGWHMIYFTFFALVSLIGLIVFHFLSKLVPKLKLGTNLPLSKKQKILSNIIGFLASLIIAILV